MNEQSNYYNDSSIPCESGGDEYCDIELGIDNGNSSPETTTYIREYFADNPVFDIITSGTDGITVFKFKVPDNITEWRLTAVANSNVGSKVVSERMFGSSVSDVICTQPYFINVSSCEKYIVGDDITVSARSYGTALSEVDSVNYSAEVIDADGKKVGSLDVSGDSDEYAWFNFGKLPAGTFYVTITSKCGEYTDGVKLSFNVVESGNIVSIRKDLAVDQIKELKPLTYPLTLSFYNASYDEYIKAINLIRWNAYARADSKAAYYVSLMASEALFGTNETQELATIREQFNRINGLISLFDYSEGDIYLTAKICTIAPEVLSDTVKENIVNTLNTFLSTKNYNNDTELCAIMLALASFGEPVLDELYYISSGCSSFSIEAKLYLCAAFAYIGDFSAANDIYSSLKDEYGNFTEGDELYFKGDNTEDNIKLTALALISAARINRSDSESIINYLLQHQSSSEYYGLEIVSHVKYYMPSEEIESSFTYRFGDDGEIKTIDLNAGKVYYLSLTKSGFESLQIISADDNIRVRAAYGGSPADALNGAETTKELKVSKTITQYGENPDLYLVTINFNGKSDRTWLNFQISDCIPTGARFVTGINQERNVTATSGKEGNAYIYYSGDQQMQGYISIWTRNSTNWNERCSEYSFSGRVSYLIRGAVTGEFIAEEPLVRNNSTGAYAVGNRLLITINDSKWDIK